MASRDRRRVAPRLVATPRPRRGLPPLANIGLVAVGGAVGALARVALAVRFPIADDALPWTTLVENLAGAFLLGLVLTMLTERFVSGRWVRLLVCTGTLGAFTTYATLAVELSRRVLGGHLLLAALYLAASLVGGLVAAFAGMRAARAWPWVPVRLRTGLRRGGQR